MWYRFAHGYLFLELDKCIRPLHIVFEGLPKIVAVCMTLRLSLVSAYPFDFGVLNVAQGSNLATELVEYLKFLMLIELVA